MEDLVFYLSTHSDGVCSIEMSVYWHSHIDGCANHV